MPYGEVKLIPGVNTERTPTLLEAGISQSQLIRFKDGLVQKYGGWQKYNGSNSTVGGVPRDLHAWEDLNSTKWLMVGTTTSLSLINSSANSILDITPQQITTNPAPNFSTVQNSNIVTIIDAALTGAVTIFDAVMINTPVAVGGLVLSGLYQINTIVGSTPPTVSYTILAASKAASTANNTGAVPVFTTTSASATVSALITANGVVVSDTVIFQATTTGNGVTIYKHYTASTVTDANNFTFVVPNLATASGSFSMNGGTAQLVYYINIGPQSVGSGFGIGGFGLGVFGVGETSSPTQLTGTPITATDWTSDNWGEIILSCPYGGGVYQYLPSGGFTNAALISTAPPFNGGIFVSNSLQILFCWGSSDQQGIGVELDPMLVSWSDQGDYTQFQASTTNQAGNFRIPIGSVIRGGMAVSNQNLFWTDLDLWAANYAGFPLVFGFNKIGSGAGAISSHSMQQLRDGVYWMGPTNIYSYTGAGVSVVHCPVWDAVFQNINTAYASNVRVMPNTGFNEAGWLYPSTASTSGECDSYVKMNITEPGQPWDYGTLARSAWIDQSILGAPISAISSGLIYQQETTRDADGTALMSSFTTGYFYIGEGQEFAFVDQIIPDMKWDFFGSSSSAQVLLTFNVINYPGDTPTTYGPYTMISTTEEIAVRFRGRQMSVTCASNDIGSWWRLGKIRYRYSPAGRR